jgi:hypothetical protein
MDMDGQFHQATNGTTKFPTFSDEVWVFLDNSCNFMFEMVLAGSIGFKGF